MEGRALKNCPVGNFSEGARLQRSGEKGGEGDGEMGRKRD